MPSCIPTRTLSQIILSCLLRSTHASRLCLQDISHVALIVRGFQCPVSSCKKHLQLDTGDWNDRCCMRYVYFSSHLDAPVTLPVSPVPTISPSSTPFSRFTRAILSWVPTAWLQLLQLLLDASPEIRSASAALIGTIGAGLASRQPADQQRAPHAGRPPHPTRQQQPALAPAALFEWALPALSTGQIAGRRQRLLVEQQVCVTACLAGTPSRTVPLPTPLSGQTLQFVVCWCLRRTHPCELRCNVHRTWQKWGSEHCNI